MFPSLIARLRSLRLRDNSGFTLVELMVVVAILSILGAATVTLISSIFESNVRSQQRLDQQTQIESLYGFLASRMAIAQRPVGLQKNTGCPGDNNPCINPLSIAGDQLLFTSGGVCYRIFYLRDQKSIRGATANNCDDIAPKRGPNETLPDNGQTGGDGDGNWEDGEPYYDAVLDVTPGQEGGAFILANNVTSTRPETAPSGYPNPLQIFTYLNEQNRSFGPSFDDNPNKYACTEGQVPADTTAGTPKANCDVSQWYDTFANRSEILSTDFTAYVAATLTQPNVAPLVYQQNLSFQQVCSTPGNGATGITPGTVMTRSVKSGAATGSPDITQTYAPVSISASADLESNKVDTQTAWFNYNGQITVAGVTAAPVQVEVRLYRFAEGSSTGTVVSDSTGRQAQVFSLGQTVTGTGNEMSLPFQGAFKLPRQGGGDDPGDTYQIRVFVKGESGTYSRDESKLFLDSEVVASS